MKIRYSHISLSLFSILLIFFYFLPFSFKGKIKDNYKSDEYLRMGINNMNEEEISKGIFYLKETIRIQPEYALNHFYLGYFLYLYGNVDSSIVYFRNCIEKDPEFYDAYFFLGKILCEKGELKEGISYLESAIQLNPYYLNAYKELGKYFLKIGNLEGFKEIQRRIDFLEGKR